MGKLKEIWQIIKRRDYKDGDEVHIFPIQGGFAVSDQLYQSLKPNLEEPAADTKYLGELYGMKVLTTPYLPYIYRDAKKKANRF